MKAEVTSATLEVPADAKHAVTLLLADLKAAGRIHELSIAEGIEIAMTNIVLAPVEEA